jgi:hypothetical protein
MYWLASLVRWKHAAFRPARTLFAKAGGYSGPDFDRSELTSPSCETGIFLISEKMQLPGSQTAIQHIEDKTDAGKCIFAAVK